MSDLKPGNELSTEQASNVGGGVDTCSASELVTLTENLIQGYENLVSFASHVIERVSGQ